MKNREANGNIGHLKQLRLKHGATLILYRRTNDVNPSLAVSRLNHVEQTH
jgi:hypothetical protein